MRRRIVFKTGVKTSENGLGAYGQGRGTILIFRYSISIDSATFDPGGTSAAAGLEVL
jgi:hypothetical protein